MKKIIIVSVVLLCIACSVFAGGAREDEFKDMSVEEVIKKMGEPKYKGERIIDETTMVIGTEPYFPEFFTEEELKNTVTIYVCVWEKAFRYTRLWAKKIDDDWIVFDSFSYIPSPFIIYE